MISSRRFTPSRIAALAAIAAVALSLGLVRLARDDDRVHVPAGARAGQLTLSACEVDGLKADCGTLVVRENRQDPRSRLIALPVKRIRAQSDHPAAPVFRLEGGPGITNMSFPYADRFAGGRDVVMVGYRGVDGSSVLDCPEVEDARRTSGDLLSQRSLAASARAYGACASRLQDDGADLGGYSVAERADDLEDARRAFGYGRIDLLSESAGTRTAMVFAWRHPGSVRRSVMIGVNPPGRLVFDPADTTAQLGRFDALCAADADCTRPSGGFAASMRRVDADMPERWGPFPIRRGNVQLASAFGLMETSGAADPVSAPMTLGTWRSVERGDASGLWFQSFAAQLLFPRAMVWGDAASIGRADLAAAQRHFAASAGSPLGDPVNRFQWAGGRLLRGWPVNHDDDAYARVRTSDAETLLVSGTLDGATPLTGDTRDLLRHLPNGHQVVLDGFGHTTDFWNEQTAAGTRLVTAFLDRGVVDDSAYVPRRADMSPRTTQPMVAKIVAGSLLGLALLAVALLLWLGARVRSGRRFGSVPAALVRSVVAALVGLGGWAAVALVAMIAFPDVPVDAPLVVVLAVGVPVALALACAVPGVRWRTVLPLAASALAGAWLGYEAGGPLLGVFTAVPAAVAAANLPLVAR